jgi:hypothetical protein
MVDARRMSTKKGCDVTQRRKDGCCALWERADTRADGHLTDKRLMTHEHNAMTTVPRYVLRSLLILVAHHNITHLTSHQTTRERLVDANRLL